MPPLDNWYSVAVGELPLGVARLTCQRSNCWWDSKQRRRYASWVVAAVVIIFLLLLALSLGGDLTLEDFMLKVAAPVSPALVLGLRQFSEQTEAASRLDSLKGHSETIWEQALGRKAKADVDSLSRSLQDEIFENRRKSPLVFDAVFSRLRRDYESQMNHGVAYYVDEAKRSLRAP